MRTFVGVVVLFCLLLAPGYAAEPGALAVVAEVSEGPGNITVVADGTVVMSLHPFYAPTNRVVAVGEGGALEPWPSEAWTTGDPDRTSLDAVLGIQAGRRGLVVWMLDNGLRGGVTPKLVGWHAQQKRLIQVVHLPPPVTRADSFVNDLAVDSDRKTVYIADPAGGKDAALIVVNLITGHARRVLEGHESVVPEDVDLVIDGTPVEVVTPDGTKIRPRVGVNPIALDASNTWLYFGPMHGTSLYRIRLTYLGKEDYTPEKLAARVERYSDKPICDGISMDDEDNIYVTDVANHAIGVIDGKTREYRIFAQDEKLLQWPDALAFGHDGMLYTVSNQLHRSARLNGGTLAAKPPFYVLKIQPLAKGTPGR